MPLRCFVFDSSAWHSLFLTCLEKEQVNEWTSNVILECLQLEVILLSLKGNSNILLLVILVFKHVLIIYRQVLDLLSNKLHSTDTWQYSRLTSEFHKYFINKRFVTMNVAAYWLRRVVKLLWLRRVPCGQRDVGSRVCCALPPWEADVICHCHTYDMTGSSLFFCYTTVEIRRNSNF